MLASGAFSIPHKNVTAEIAEKAVNMYIAHTRSLSSPSKQKIQQQSQRRFFPQQQSQNKKINRRSSLSAPPASPTLYDIFLHERQLQGNGSTDKKTFRESLRTFYLQHNPTLVPRVESIAKEWENQEGTLFALLRYKYDRCAEPLQQQETSPRRSFGSNGDQSKKLPQKKRGVSCRPSFSRTSEESPSTFAALRQEISRLKDDVQAAQQRADRAKARAAAAARAAETAQRELKADRDTAQKLRVQSATLRRERDSHHSELHNLKQKLQLKEDNHEPLFLDLSVEELALNAVESAVIDVLLAEAGIEIDFELDHSPSISLLAYNEKPLSVPLPPLTASPPRVMPLVTPEDLFPNPSSPSTTCY
mmetsp:Transcript_18985/g.28668  ORF Transcript_18985/g.28668 Transcript_18985/m.28668 type:complete len:362 (+) Transcript_18985:784-1869(+)